MSWLCLDGCTEGKLIGACCILLMSKLGNIMNFALNLTICVADCPFEPPTLSSTHRTSSTTAGDCQGLPGTTRDVAGLRVQKRSHSFNIEYCDKREIHNNQMVWLTKDELFVEHFPLLVRNSPPRSCSSLVGYSNERFS